MNQFIPHHGSVSLGDGRPAARAARGRLAVLALTPLALALLALPAAASEGYKLRQSPVGLFGGEIAANADNPGFFGTASLAYTRIYRIANDAGDDLAVLPRVVPLPTGTPTGGAVPNGTYSLSVPAGKINFRQSQTQLNLVGGYLTEQKYADGRLALTVNVPLIKQSRTFQATQPLGSITPDLPAAMPAPLRNGVTTIAAGANAQVQAGVAATANGQNADTSAIGDTEVSALWVRHTDRLQVAAGVSLFLPTGEYDKTRGPNPGFGNFYTLRPGVAVTYKLNPNPSDSTWDAGVTVAGRVSYGHNTRNKDTDYRSGDFVYAEAAVVKVAGNWALGANLAGTQQVSDDSGPTAPANGQRYRNYATGPFVSYKIPGQEAGFNLHYSRNFGSRNALVSETLQLRFIKAW